MSIISSHFIDMSMILAQIEPNDAVFGGIYNNIIKINIF